jgi:hypothetical protein
MEFSDINRNHVTVVCDMKDSKEFILYDMWLYSYKQYFSWPKDITLWGSECDFAVL